MSNNRNEISQHWARHMRETPDDVVDTKAMYREYCEAKQEIGERPFTFDQWLEIETA